MANTTPPHNPLEGPRPEMTMYFNENSDEQISIIVVSKDKPQYLNLCLQSISANTINNDYELIVVDNASDKETQDLLDEVEKLGHKVIRNKKNLYWSEAANLGAAAANKHSKYFVFLHSDVVILNSSWLDLLIGSSEAENSGLVGLEINSYIMNNQKLDFINGFCTLFTRECFETIGGYPKELPIVGQDFIVSIEAQHAGFKPQMMKGHVVHHYKIFSVDINEYERAVELAQVEIPKLMRKIQSKAMTSGV